MRHREKTLVEMLREQERNGQARSESDDAPPAQNPSAETEARIRAMQRDMGFGGVWGWVYSPQGRASSPPADGQAAPEAEPPRALDEVDAADLAHSSGDDFAMSYLPLLGQDGYLVKGWSHLLAGYARSGKTELLTPCCREWLSMGISVLYITEEPRCIWHQRLAHAPDVWRGMRLLFGLGADPQQLLDRLSRGTESIVVIDAIRNLGLVGDDENDNTALARHLNPWIRAARDRRKTLILVHHDRKGGGEHGQAIAGGHALLGCVDIALELVRDAAPSRRVIRAYARIIQPAELLYERREDGTMHALGSPDKVSLAEVRKRVVDVLEPEEWLKTAEVRERLEVPKSSLRTVRDALTEEAKAGTVERDPALSEDVRGKTLRWRPVVPAKT